MVMLFLSNCNIFSPFHFIFSLVCSFFTLDCCYFNLYTTCYYYYCKKLGLCDEWRNVVHNDDDAVKLSWKPTFKPSNNFLCYFVHADSPKGKLTVFYISMSRVLSNFVMFCENYYIKDNILYDIPHCISLPNYTDLNLLKRLYKKMQHLFRFY